MNDKLPIPGNKTIAAMIEMMAELAAQNAATRALLVDFLARVSDQPHEEIARQAEVIVKNAKADYVRALYAEFGPIPADITEALSNTDI